MARAQKRTQKRGWKIFLRWLAKTGNVEFSAMKAGVSRRGVYSRLEHNADFKDQVEDARKLAVAFLEEEARRRAHDGVKEPQFYKGVVCGYVKKYSDGILQFLLRANDPKKYGDKMILGGDRESPVHVEHEVVVTDHRQYARSLLNSLMGIPQQNPLDAPPEPS